MKRLGILFLALALLLPCLWTAGAAEGGGTTLYHGTPGTSWANTIQFWQTNTSQGWRSFCITDEFGTQPSAEFYNSRIDGSGLPEGEGLCIELVGLSIPTAAALTYSFVYNATYMIPEVIVLLLVAYYIGSSLDFRQTSIAPYQRSAVKGIPALRWVSGIVLTAGLVFITVTVFGKMQNAETGEFDVTGSGLDGRSHCRRRLAGIRRRPVHCLPRRPLRCPGGQASISPARAGGVPSPCVEERPRFFI